jgi:hypothetical protein
MESGSLSKPYLVALYISSKKAAPRKRAYFNGRALHRRARSLQSHGWDPWRRQTPLFVWTLPSLLEAILRSICSIVDIYLLQTTRISNRATQSLGPASFRMSALYSRYHCYSNEKMALDFFKRTSTSHIPGCCSTRHS